MTRGEGWEHPRPGRSMDLKSQEVETLRPFNNARGSDSWGLTLNFNLEGEPQQRTHVQQQRLGFITAAPCLATRTIFLYQTPASELENLASHYQVRARRRSNPHQDALSGSAAYLTLSLHSVTRGTRRSGRHGAGRPTFSPRSTRPPHGIC